jgi:hypothetical protein
LHTSTFDRAAAVALLKELMRLIVGRGGSDDRGETKGGDKMNLVIDGGEMVNLLVVLHNEIFISINKYINFFFNFS